MSKSTILVLPTQDLRLRSEGGRIELRIIMMIASLLIGIVTRNGTQDTRVVSAHPSRL